MSVELQDGSKWAASGGPRHNLNFKFYPEIVHFAAVLWLHYRPIRGWVCTDLTNEKQGRENMKRERRRRTDVTSSAPGENEEKYKFQVRQCQAQKTLEI